MFPACLSMCYNLMLSVTLSMAQIRAFSECHVSKQPCLSRGRWDFFSSLFSSFFHAFLKEGKCFCICRRVEIFSITLSFNTAALYRSRNMTLLQWPLLRKKTKQKVAQTLIRISKTYRIPGRIEKGKARYI